jgi:ABC-type transport system substrate-binding protein
MQLRRSLWLALALVFLPFRAYAQDEGAGPEISVVLPAPQGLDPVSLSRFDLGGRDVVENLYIGLTRFNARTGQVEPALAQAWTVSHEGLTWRFTLRDDIQWVRREPDGTWAAVRPVTAGDVAFAIQRACDPLRPSPVTRSLDLIAGCRTLRTNNSPTPLNPAQTVAVRALDETTLEIRLLFPAGYFLTLTSQPEMRPLPPETTDLAGAALWTSGPWVLESFVQGEAARLTANPHWPLEREGNLEALTLRFDLSPEALPSALAGGEIQAARLVGGATLPESASGDGGTLRLLGFSFNALASNGLPIPSPLDSPLVRRALALALDRPALVAAVYGASAGAAERFTPASAIAAPSVRGAGYNATLAQSTLAEAGYPACTGLGVLTLAVDEDPRHLRMAQTLVGQWGAALGCTAETFPIVQTTRADVLASAHGMVDLLEGQARYPLWLATWTADYPDAQGWIGEALHCAYGYFRVGRPCDGVDSLLDQASVISDVLTRFPLYNQAETAFFGDGGSFPVVPLALERHAWAVDPRLEGLPRYGPWQFDRWTLAE